LNGMSCNQIALAIPHICGRSGFVCDTADIVRRSLVTRIQDGGYHFRFRWPPS
jgi:hypothetical protein